MDNGKIKHKKSNLIKKITTRTIKRGKEDKKCIKDKVYSLPNTTCAKEEN